MSGTVRHLQAKLFDGLIGGIIFIDTIYTIQYHHVNLVLMMVLIVCNAMIVNYKYSLKCDFIMMVSKGGERKC